MSDTNALPTPQPSTANLVEIIVPGFIRVNVPKADAEKLYQSLGVTLGHRPAENPMPQQAWNLDAMRIEKNIASIRNESTEGSTIDSLRWDAKHLLDQIANLHLQLAESRHENSQIQGQLADRTADVNELTGKLRDVQVWMGKSKDENTRLTSSLEALEKDRLDLSGSCNSALEKIDKLKVEVEAATVLQWNPPTHSEVELACMTIQQQLRMVANSISTNSSPGQLQAANIIRVGATTIDVVQEQLRCAEALNRFAPKEEPIRNPEGIDFVKYPIPDGYVVASDEDCKGGVQEYWMVHTESRGWFTVDNPLVCRTAHEEYTYLRPIREDEKPAAGPLAGAIIDHLKEAADNERKIKALRVHHNPENIDLAKHPLPPGYVIASKEEIPDMVPGDWLYFDDINELQTWEPFGVMSIPRPDFTYARPIQPGDQEAPLP